MTKQLEKPLLFSAPMVKALLDGSKTMTRRLVKPQPVQFGGKWCFSFKGNERAVDAIDALDCAPHPKGSLIWCKETFSPWSDEFTKRVVRSNDAAVYRADFRHGTTSLEVGGCEHWKPSIFMPRKLSRITLQLDDVRVERVQDISEEDAKAEGCQPCDKWPLGTSKYRRGFSILWDSINFKKAPWSSNPWVWVYSFHRVTKEASK